MDDRFFLLTFDKKNILIRNFIDCFLRTDAAIKGFIMCGLRIVLVTPKKWQKEMYEGIKPNPDKKVMSGLAAKRLFPRQDLRRTEN